MMMINDSNHFKDVPFSTQSLQSSPKGPVTSNSMFNFYTQKPTLLKESSSGNSQDNQKLSHSPQNNASYRNELTPLDPKELSNCSLKYGK